MRYLLLTFFFAITSVNAANAASVVLSNFSEPRLCSNIFCFGIGPEAPAAQSFTTDGFDVSVNTVRTEVNLNGVTPDDLVVSFFSSENGLPGQQIGSALSFTDVEENGPFDIFTFSATDITLSANTTFWFVFSTLAGNPQFQQAASTDSIGFALGPIANVGNPVFGVPGFVLDLETDSQRVLLEIDGTAVSEVPLPAAAWVFLAGLGGLRAMRRKGSAHNA